MFRKVIKLLEKGVCGNRDVTGRKRERNAVVGTLKMTDRLKRERSDLQMSCRWRSEGSSDGQIVVESKRERENNRIATIARWSSSKRIERRWKTWEETRLVEKEEEKKLFSYSVTRIVRWAWWSDCCVVWWILRVFVVFQCIALNEEKTQWCSLL